MRLLPVVAILLLTSCASQSPEPGMGADFNQQDAARTRISLGLTYLKNGNYTQAKYNLDKALQFAPDMADAHYSMAYYYQQVEEFQQADDSYRQALRLGGQSPDILNSYGAFLCQRGRYEEARDYFLRAINSQNYIRSAESYENLALCSQSQGQIEDAKQFLQSALNHQPARSQSLLLLTEILVQQGNWQEAKQYLGRLERVGRVSPELLMYGYRIESGLQQLQRAEGYGKMLRELYPEHPLTREYRSLANVRPSVRNETSAQRSPEQPTGNETQAQTQTDRQIEPEVAGEDDEAAFHLVQEGENLYRISVKYNLKMSTLMEWNQLQDASSIYTGMKLRVTRPD